MPTTRSQGGDPPTTTKNHDADIHILKGKISKLVVDLPAYDKYEDFLVDSFEGRTFSEQIRGLTKQRIEILKAKNSISSIYVDFTTLYDRVIGEYREAPADSWIKTQMDALEKKEDITGLIESMKSHQIVLKNILIEIDETMKMIRGLKGPFQNDVIEKPESQIVTKRRFELEALQIPSFDGRAENYPEFISVFNELINSNEELSNLHKSVYLKKALKGEAAKCIEGIPATGENYERLLIKIKSRYSNSLVNQHSILRKLDNISKANDNSASCEITFNEIDIILNQLTSTGMDMFTSSDPMWQRIILRKFPERIAEKILLDSHDKRHFTINDMMNNLKRQLFSKQFLEESGFSEKSQRILTNQEPQQKSTQNNNYQYERNSNKSNLRKDIQPDINIETSCIFCPNMPHTTANCKMPHRDKKKFQRKSKRCWNCFEANHTSFDCVHEDCQCGGIHHISICEKPHLSKRGTANYNRNNNYTNDDSRINANNREQNNYQGTEKPTFQGTFNRSYTNSNRQFNHATIDEQPIFTTDNQHDEQDLQAYHTSMQPERNSQDLPTLMTCEIALFSKRANSYIRATAFFDNGSQQTLISEGLAETLGINDGDKHKLTISGVNSTSETFFGKAIVLEMLNMKGETLKIKGITKQFISKGFKSANLTDRDVKFIEDNKISIANQKVRGETVKPDILIGSDNYTKLVLNKEAVVLPSGLYLVDTEFGKSIFGVKNTNDKISDAVFANHNCIIDSPDDDIDPSEMFKQMYELESLGINHEGSPSNDRTVKFYNDFKQNICFEGSIITAPFPLKENLSKLGSNFGLAYKQLSSLTDKLKENSEMKKLYTKKLEEYRAEGIIELVSEENEISNNVAEYYIPHHGVWNAEKIEKPLRIVFGAHSKQKGCISLNEAIEVGETFVNKIADIIMSSRKSKYIIVCDIQGAFTQIRMIPDHQDVCRFLWLKDTEKGLSKDNLAIFRFKRLPFGINASPAILNMSIISFLENEQHELGKEILENLYVDNILMMAESINDVKSKIKQSKDLFNKISFNLREYVTNSDEINQSLPETDKGKFGKTKILGVAYNTASDSYTVQANVKMEKIITKRTVLKQLHSIYDPIGLLTPAVISLRAIMREVFGTTKHWNDVITPELKLSWLSELEQFHNAEVTIPRFIGHEHAISSNQILWLFTDASSIASAACSYLQDKISGKLSKIISGKAKLTPKVKIPFEDTIPKYEFASILLGVQLAKNVVKNLDLQNCEVYIANDSTSALSWVSYSKKIRRSCKLIREKILSAEREIKNTYETNVRFFHCPGEMNVADIATRGYSPSDLQECEWEKIEEPSEEPDVEKPQINQVILKVKSSKAKSRLLPDDDVSPFEAKAKAAKILNRLKVEPVVNEITKENLPESAKSILEDMSGDDNPTPGDLILAEKIIVIDEQKDFEITLIKNKYKQKEPFIDENGIVRLNSRITNANLQRDTMQPIFLPADSQWLKLLIIDFHNDNGHCGKEHLLMLLRQKYWIPRPCKTINKILRECESCRISKCMPFKAPLMAPLPFDRLSSILPFQNTGIDCLGPFEIKNAESVNVCLFTCLVTRCIHLEVVHNMSAGDFLKAFIRFVSRRGKPKLIRSDNGTNFVLGGRLIEELYKRASSTQFCIENEIDIQSAQLPLDGRTVGRNKLSLDEFQTVMTKVEGIVKSRPLTSVTDENPVPLRPVDFLIPKIEISIKNFNNNFEEEEYFPNICATEKEARKAVEKIEKLTNTFWDRYKKEYLPRLREAQTLRIKQGRTAKERTPEIGEIVLIEDDFLPKHRWNIARIVELHKSADGFIRTVTVEYNEKRMLRPIIRLYPLEIKALSNHISESASINDERETINNTVDTGKEIRPIRNAARDANYRITSIINEANDDSSFTKTDRSE